MSYEEFRRRIDTARQILVGAVPSPAGQIDQITYALIYKFMNDIDDKSASLGGKRSYFTGDYEKYNWNNLMSPSLGAHERLELYRQAVQTMAKNPNLPPMFAEIYQNAFLPFNSANVLTLFLKEIDKFSHGESDDIGDAYEYLLSITGAQGDVGQFRTPRHIIEFVVDAVNPDKDDSVLDPACGTAGFLIKAYEHVMTQHDGKDAQGNANDEKRLSASELDKIHHNYHGFDIDPTMVRTAKVNMYLHGFTSPDIINHDSLSDEKYWEKRYDVILANPPFMTPKGGIQPHKKFSVSANRAEVLFVDYIMSHLNPVSGRAGIIVPEGIIFQSGKAYKQLRKNLIENSLYAVVSLPSGVFNPYAGVKTSILLLDKQLAKERDEVLFVKVENDGYSLGAQRRPIAGNQFPEALEALEQFRTGAEPTSQLAHTVKKSEIAKSGDYNLSGERYRQEIVDVGDFPNVDISNYIEYVRGLTYSKKDEVVDDGIKVLRANNIDLATGDINLDDVKVVSNNIKTKASQRLVAGDIFICAASGSKEHIGKVAYIKEDLPFYFGGFMAAIRTKEGLDSKYLYYQLRSESFNQHLRRSISGVNINNLNNKILGSYKIPLPPLEIQRQIVDELDGYQRIIDAATAIVKTYKPTIKINPEWESVDLGSILQDKPTYGSGASKTEFDGTNRYVRITDITDEGELKISDIVSPSLIESKYFIQDGDLLIARSGSVGRTYYHEADSLDSINYQWAGYLINFRIDSAKADSKFVSLVTKSPTWWSWIDKYSKTGTLTNINAKEYSTFMVPLPPIEEQKQIVADLEAEQKLIDSSKKLITLYQQKIRTKIAEIWGE